MTSVEPDHLEHYGSFEALKRPSRTFLGQVGLPRSSAPTTRSPRSLAPASARRPTAARDGRRAADRRRRVGRSDRPLRAAARRRGASATFELPVPGLHNARNAAAAVAAAVGLGVEPEHARRALARFAGVARRFEFRGEAGGVTFVDDYAHLPGEVQRRPRRRARAAGSRGSSASSSPTATRGVATLARDFADAFEDADVVA